MVKTPYQTPATVRKQIIFYRYNRDWVTTLILSILIAIISQFLAYILISLYPAFRNWTETEATAWLDSSIAAQFSFVLLAELLCVALVFQFLKLARVSVHQIGLIAPKLTDIGRAFVSYGLYFLTYLAVILIASKVFIGLDLEQEQRTGFEFAYKNVELIMTFFSLVILPPLAEEILFRGFLFSGLRARLRFRYATLITGILFGLAHLQFGSGAPLLWVVAIDTFILSCFLCYLRERTGSLWPPIFLHVIKNSLAFFVLFGARFLS